MILVFLRLHIQKREAGFIASVVTLASPLAGMKKEALDGPGDSKKRLLIFLSDKIVHRTRIN
jgi:hypothetical protein